MILINQAFLTDIFEDLVVRDNTEATAGLRYFSNYFFLYYNIFMLYI